MGAGNTALIRKQSASLGKGIPMYLERNQVPEHLRRSYTGAKFQAEARDFVTVPFEAGLWSGGSRDSYTAIELSTGKALPMPGQDLAPWDKERQSYKVELKPGFSIVRHSMFQGTDLGLTFYVHSSDIAALIPQDSGAELSDLELYFLAVVRGIKSSYRVDYYRRKGMTEAQIDAFKAKLCELGYLNKAGAITVKGKNVCEKINP
jgi:hypothetical protein